MGALMRARSALEAVSEAELGIGLEGGLLAIGDDVFTCAWCAVTDRAGRVGWGGSVNLLLPKVVAERVRQGMELGPAMDVLSGIADSKKKMGAVGLLTNGLLDRQTAYEMLVKLALARFRSPYYDT